MTRAVTSKSGKRSSASAATERRSGHIIVFLGPDGAGLPSLPARLELTEEVMGKNFLQPVAYCGTRAMVEERAEELCQRLHSEGWNAGSEVHERQKPFWTRPVLLLNVTAFRC